MDVNPAVIFSPAYECDIGPHVFPVQKFRLLLDRLVASGHVARAAVLEPGPAPRELLLRVHEAAFLDDLEHLRWTPRTFASELPLSREIVYAYQLAAAGTALAAREAMTRGVAMNLGGGFHHAFRDHAEGFCYLNDLAVAAQQRVDDGAGRVAIVDLDVHQGNGTAAIFEGDPNVFTLSIHQERNYPVPKQRSDLDIGLDDGVGDHEYLEALEGALERVWSFEPGLVLYQAGADPYGEDLLGGLKLSFEGLKERDRRVILGARSRGIPVVVTLGGGYARKVEDTVQIHETTCRLALEAARLAPSRK